MQLSLLDARVSPADHTWLTNVYPFYLHDLSEFDGGYYHLTEQGQWEPDHLPSWLDDQEDWPLLILADGRRVGFALVNQAPSPYMRPGSDYRMSEFFVLRQWRRTSVGQGAARMVFERFRGQWELSVFERNTGALAFWRHLITTTTKRQYAEQPVNNTIQFFFRS